MAVNGKKYNSNGYNHWDTKHVIEKYYSITCLVSTYHIDNTARYYTNDNIVKVLLDIINHIMLNYIYNNTFTMLSFV